MLSRVVDVKTLNILLKVAVEVKFVDMIRSFDDFDSHKQSVPPTLIVMNYPEPKLPLKITENEN